MHVHVQRLVSVVKMVTVHEECTIEEKHSVVLFFCGQKDSVQRIFIKKCFQFTVGNVCHVKQFTVGLRNCHFGGRRLADDEVEMEVQKWLKQQSKDFYAVGFDTLVKRQDKCINVGGGYVEK
jgi:hypothetical protein